MAEFRQIVVVGASLAGLGAAEGLRRAGFDGRLIMVGDEPHAPYNRPPLSKEVLTGVATAESAMHPAERLTRLGVELLLGQPATGLDLAEQVVEVGAERIRFDGLVVATGASPRRLPALEGLEGVHVLRTLDDARAIRAALDRGGRLVVVGAGFIGSEVAASARACGLEVTIVELAENPLAQALGPEIGGALARLHEEHGTDLRCGTTVAAVEGAGRVERVRLSDGSDLDASALLVAVGVAPATGWLEGSGLTIADGVVCDATLNAGHPAVFAAGDVARWPNELFGRAMRVEHWTNADEQGVRAGENLIAGPAAAAPYVGENYVWSDQYGLRIQFAGSALADEVVVVDGSLDSRTFLAWYREGERLVGAVGIGVPKLIARSRRLIRQRASWADALASLS